MRRLKIKSDRYINASDDATAKLARAFNTSEGYVYQCLTFRRNGEKALRIRHAALRQFGARLMLNLPSSELLRLLPGSDGPLMKQEFDNGAVLLADADSGEVKVFDRAGRLRRSWNRADIPQLAKIQRYASRI